MTDPALQHIPSFDGISSFALLHI